MLVGALSMVTTRLTFFTSIHVPAARSLPGGEVGELRREIGRDGEPTGVVAMSDALTAADFARAEADGITDAMTMPSLYDHGFRATLDQNIDGMERFAQGVLAQLG